jgi:DNA-binding CsgD family transcriptional regulator
MRVDDTGNQDFREENRGFLGNLSLRQRISRHGRAGRENSRASRGPILATIDAMATATAELVLEDAAHHGPETHPSPATAATAIAAAIAAAAGTWPLVGRATELERIATAMKQTCGSGVVLIGAAGVGKSRLVRECLSAAAEAGFETVRIVATRAARSIPLGALAPVLPPTPAHAEPLLRGDVLRWAADAIAEYAEGPLFLTVDDAHCLDEASATVLHQLAVERRAFMLVTVRAGEPVSDAVHALWKDALLDRLDVDVLSRRDAERLLMSVLRGPVDGSTLRNLWDVSEGNPLLLREVVIGGLGAGTLINDGGLWRSTRTVAPSARLTELVDERMHGLDPIDRDALETLAVGEPLGPDVLLGRFPLDVWERLQARGLIDVTTDGRRTVMRLAHPLYGEVLRAQVQSMRAMGIRRYLADTLEGAGARRREDLLRVAVWRLDGGGTVHADLMLEAARQAHFAFDHPLAERLARAAYDAGAKVPAGLLLAEVLIARGNHEASDRVLAVLSTEVDNPIDRAMVGLSRGSALFWGMGQYEAAIAVLEDTEAALPDGPLRDEARGVLASHELLGGFPQKALETASTVLDRDEAADGRAIVQASIARVGALAIAGECTRASAAAARAHEVHLALGDQQMLAKPWIHTVLHVLALTEGGDIVGAQRIASEEYQLAIDRREQAAQAWFAMMLGRVALIAGLLRQADRWFVEGNALYRELGHDGPRRWCLAGRVLAAAFGNDVDAVDKPFAELVALESPMAMMESEVLRAHAWRAQVTGDPVAARTLLWEAVEISLGHGAYTLAASALHDLVRLGATAGVVDAFARIPTTVESPMTVAQRAHAVAVDAEDAGALCAIGVELEDRGATLLACEVFASAAAVYRRRHEGRVAQAAESASQRLREQCEGARTPALTGLGQVAPLTQRQREVALLAAQGLSSKQIAERLILSIRTVDNYLQQVYRKFGITGRDDLADVLLADAG